jgi:hypothetical protein
MLSNVALCYGCAARSIIQRETVERKVYDAFYTGKQTNSWGGTRLYKWVGWIKVGGLPIIVESWGYRSDTQPLSGWADDVFHQIWDKLPRPEWNCDWPTWAKYTGEMFTREQIVKFMHKQEEED